MTVARRKNRTDEASSLKLRLFSPKIIDVAFSKTRYAATTVLAPAVIIVLAAAAGDIAKIGAEEGVGPIEWYWTTSVLEVWYLWNLLFWLILAAWSIVRWRSKTHELLRWLPGSGRLRVRKGEFETGFQKFVKDYADALTIRKGRYLILALMLMIWIGAIVAFGVLEYWLEILALDKALCNALPQYCRTERFNGLLTFLMFFGLLVWIYCASSVGWAMVVTGRQIRKLTEKFEVILRPRHPDRCGGLKRLGDFCFDMTLPVIMGIAMLAVFGVGGLVLFLAEPEIEFAGFQLNIDIVTVVVSNVVLVVAGFPLLSATFLRPLLSIHDFMSERRKAAEDQFAITATRLEREIRQHLGQSEDLDRAKTAKEELEIMQVLNPNSIGYPTWPFRPRILISVFSPQLLAFVALIVSIFELLK